MRISDWSSDVCSSDLGPADETPDLYIKVNRVVPKLVRQTEEEGEGDYWVDEKAKQVHLSEDGQEHAENLLREAGILEGEDDDLYSPHNIHVVHHLNAGLRAPGIYQRDVDSILRDAQLTIVDSFTGRTPQIGKPPGSEKECRHGKY